MRCSVGTLLRSRFMQNMISLVVLNLGMFSQAVAFYEEKEVIKRFQIDWTSNTEATLAVVGVKGQLTDSGIPIFLDNEVVILTNSHVTQGKQYSEVLVPNHSLLAMELEKLRPRNIQTNGPVALKAQTIIEDPIRDFAVLRFSESLNEDLKLNLFFSAFRNGRICSGKISGCKPGFYQHILQAFGKTQILAVLNQRRSIIPLQTGLSYQTVEDSFISGQRDPVRMIPAYARPGVSGGAFYISGQLDSLVTKVSYGGDPIIIATPIAIIAKQIYQNKIQGVSAEWKSSPSGETSGLRVGIDNDVLDIIGSGGSSVGNAGDGGTTGNGGDGGTTGNGGGNGTDHGVGSESQEKRYLEFSTLSDMVKNSVVTLSPFWDARQTILLNGQVIEALKVTDLKNSSHETWQAPSLAKILFYKRRSKQYRIEYVFTSASLIFRNQLAEARTNKNQDIKMARLYQWSPIVERFEVVGLNSEGTEFLYPNSDGNWPQYAKIWGTPKDSNLHFLKNGKAEVDSEEYYQGAAVQARVNDQSIFDLQVVPIKPIDLEKLKQIQSVKLELPLDRKNLNLILEGKHGSALKISNELSLDFGSSIDREILVSDDLKLQGVILYEASDLTKINRIFIRLDSMLLELGTCLSVKECSR